jgi:hypothetical protein
LHNSYNNKRRYNRSYSNNDIKRNSRYECRLGGCNKKATNGYNYCSIPHYNSASKLKKCKNCNKSVYYDFINDKEYEHCSKECAYK